MDSNYSTRVLGHLSFGSSSLERGEAARRWSDANLERYAADHRRLNPDYKHGSYSVEYSPSRDEYQLLWRGLNAEAQRWQLMQQHQQQLAQNQLQMNLSRAQSIHNTYAPLYGATTLRTSDYSQREGVQKIIEEAAQIEEARKRKRSPLQRVGSWLRSQGLRLQVLVYSKLSGASPFTVYRQLLKERKNRE